MKPATYNCETCRKKYAMGAETTVHLYLRQPWFNHLKIDCPAGCKRTYRVWELEDDTVQYLRSNNTGEEDPVHCSVMEFAPDEIVSLFCRDNDKPLPEEPWMSPRQRAEVLRLCSYFHFELATETPDWLPSST